MSDRDGRPSPDALLKAARQDGRGKLKIFLGAAPGVGKTYQMLVAAHDRRRDGVDVVIGVVETHGRAETEALLVGLLALPRRSVSHAGHTLSEMTLTPFWRNAQRWSWLTNSPTATPRAAAIRNGTRMCWSCWRPASMSGRRSTSSTLKA